MAINNMPPRKKKSGTRKRKTGTRKRKITAYNRFFASLRRKGYSPTEIGRRWRAAKGVATTAKRRKVGVKRKRKATKKGMVRNKRTGRWYPRDSPSAKRILAGRRAARRRRASIRRRR